MPITLGNIKLFSLKELSETLSVSDVTLRSYISKGNLKARKVGGKWYVSEEALREYFNPNDIKEINV
jgi:excisionase family DNA binding protein